MKMSWLYKISICAATLYCATALSQEDISKVRIEAEKLSETTYMLTGSMAGNIGLSIGKDSVLMVDTQIAPLMPKIKKAIAKITNMPIKMVINTHWHFDHIGGNENLGKKGVLIIAHENVLKRASAESVIEFLNMRFPASPLKALPVITLSQNMSIFINGEEVTVIHMPSAHTDSDSIVYFKKSNVIHAGDIFFNKIYPFIDTSSGGTVDGVIAAVDNMLKMASNKTKIIPGHGPLAAKEDLKAYRDMLAVVSNRIKGQLKQGKSLEQVLASKPSADYDQQWGKGFLTPPKFVEMIYKNLQIQKK